MQESFVRISRVSGRVQAAELAGYTRKTILNLSRSAYRKRSRERRALERASGRGTASSSYDGDSGLEVRAALLSLRPKQRACLAMRFYEDRKEQEIAEALGMSLSAVKKQIERGLAALRPVLSERSEL